MNINLPIGKRNMYDFLSVFVGVFHMARGILTYGARHFFPSPVGEGAG